MAKEITINLKFYSGIHKALSLENYDPAKGVDITTTNRRLRSVLKDLGLTGTSSFAYFRSGERIGLWSKLYDGDQISCLKPSAGG
ncbi:MAG: hypothetical protein CVV44_06300 [Spirochaetae bacterium HGW-Spirochaetae-1]|jgi:hypothetical protein|nr:MAG: hypothetical protein CVV44_06300 [Spirochaetae bacterium HGW-Spirochaetae-1]